MIKALIDPEVIINTVSQVIGVTPEQTKSKSREREFVKARHLSMYFMRKFTDMSLKKIGSNFSNSDHATVIHASKSVNNQNDVYKAYRTEFNRIYLELNDIADIEFTRYEQLNFETV